MVQLDSALKDYSSALAINPDYEPAYNNRGSIYLVKGEHVLALWDFNKAIELNPESAEFYYNRSKVFAFTENYEDALKDALQAQTLGYPNIKDYISKLINLIATNQTPSGK